MATTYTNIGTSTGGVGTAAISLQAQTNITGADPGNAFNAVLFNSNSPANVQALTLASGANTINATNCPALANAGAVFLVPPSTNTQTITLKGASGDTGIALSLTAPHMLTFPVTPPSSFVLTTGGIITGFLLIWL